MLNRAIAMARTAAIAERRPTPGQLPLAYTMPQGLTDKLRRTLRQDAVDHDAEAAAAAVLRSGRRRRRNTQPQSAATEPTAGQRPRHHPGPPTGHPLSRVELLDKEFHARSRGGSRACAANRERKSTGALRDLRKWFEEHTHRAMTNRLEDGSDLDVEQYVSHYIDLDDRRGRRTAHLPRTAAHVPRRHDRAAARRKFLIGCARRTDLRAWNWLAPMHFRVR